MRKANLCGKQIKIARISKDMHQVELAAALSVECGIEMNQSMISSIERGSRKVSDIELNALAKILDKTVLWLMHGDR